MKRSLFGIAALAAFAALAVPAHATSGPPPLQHELRSPDLIETAALAPASVVLVATVAHVDDLVVVLPEVIEARVSAHPTPLGCAEVCIFKVASLAPD